MPNPLIRKLKAADSLTEEDQATLQRVCQRTRNVEARRDLTREGDRPENVHLVLDGFACRYKVKPDGHRHIMALLVPGDFCDLHVAILDHMDHSIATITPCTMVEIPRLTILDLTENYPGIARALWWATLVDEAVLREWLVNVGSRSANERLAHFACEMLLRLGNVGLADGDGYRLPLTQVDLADLLGMTSVHVNRTLQSLREADLIVLKSRRFHIPDVARLSAYCGFNPNYLHLRQRRDGQAG